MTTPRPDDRHRDAAERFIAGEDRLSALLRDVPRFEAPASLASAVATAARAVQARMAAEAERDAVRASAPPPAFNAPPTLSDSVLREAARLQTAQAARRDVVFEQVLQGKPADAVLGAPVSAPTEAWLRTQAMQHRDEAAAVASAVPPPARRASAVARWWRSLGVAATAFAVAGLATKIVLSQLDDGTPMTASLSSNVVIADKAGPAVQGEAALASAPALAATPSTSSTPPAQEAQTEGAPSTPGLARTAPPAEPVRRPTTPSPAARKERAREPSPAFAPSPSPAPSTPPVTATAEPVPPTPAAPAAPAILAAPPPMASMQAQADAAPAPPSAPALAPAPAPPPAAAPAPAPGVAADARARRVPQSAFLAAPAAAGLTAESASESAAESAAPAKATAKAAAPVARKSATVTLEDDPASVAMQWRPGRGLHVWSAEPDNAAVRDWVARLWAAMPADARPVAPYGIQRDDALARGQLRIEQGAERPDVR
ncbi:hypothetical protein [Cupriavidus pauculus]|uniref:Uncharacterized protein n=1 Tax=Cupriavidus pauculus TaxID=82633 RepID=A0A2N5C8R4_9BURK|nr:hypothetical protein [Cupriavidus pauculus]PLP98607.1 hypothetical protein CYJ10_20065 [Cupriavidus pauculus]